MKCDSNLETFLLEPKLPSRLELNSVNNQIIQVKQGMAPGNIDINVLFQKEAELKRRMFET